jgi:hypothetical protein
MLSAIVRVQHKKTLVWPLDAACVPLFIPRMLVPVIEDLDRGIGSETKATNKKVMLEV